MASIHNKFLIIFIVLFTNVSVFHAQSGWNTQTSGVNTFLWGISFVNSNTGFIASDGGKVLKTTNGGNNWSIQNLTPPVDVTSIHFVNSQTGYAAGSQGKIFKTTN